MKYEAFQASIGVNKTICQGFALHHWDNPHLHFGLPGYSGQDHWMVAAVQIQFLY